MLLKRTGWLVNHKRVERIRREDNLLCVAKRRSSGDDGFAASVPAVSEPGADGGADDGQSALGGRHYLCSTGRSSSIWRWFWMPSVGG